MIEEAAKLADVRLVTIGNASLVASEDAEAIVEACGALGLVILGIEGFEIQDGRKTPRMDAPYLEFTLARTADDDLVALAGSPDRQDRARAARGLAELGPSAPEGLLEALLHDTAVVEEGVVALLRRRDDWGADEVLRTIAGSGGDFLNVVFEEFGPRGSPSWSGWPRPASTIPTLKWPPGRTSC